METSLKAKKKSAAKKPLVRKKAAPKRETPAKRRALSGELILKKQAAKLGRPTDYRPEYDEEAYKLCLAGLIDEQLAEFFDISVPTLYSWRKKFPSFLKAGKLGKIIADARVAGALHNRAIGMKTTETHIGMHEGRVVITKYQKEHLPDVNACRFWLKNRQPDKWRENIGITDGGGKGLFSLVIHEELKPKDQEE